MAYYQNDKEKEMLIEKMKAFDFEQMDLLPDNYFTLISGEQGSGKTHLACSMTEVMPVYLLDTELRGSIVARKFSKNKFPLRYTRVRSYSDIVVAFKTIIKNYAKEPGAIVIDSGSDFQQFAETRYKEVAKVEKVWPQYLWSMIWQMCDDIIYDIRDSNMMLVMTSRMKDEYVGDKSTGGVVPRIYNRVPYNADVCLELYPENKEKPIQITKNGFTGDLDIQLDRGLSLPSILKKLQKEDK